jgi:hypothetical protein
MLKPTLRTKIWFWKRRAEARYCRASVFLFFAIFRYHLLCFKHYGWRRIAIYLLETPEHLKAIGLALFTHRRDIPELTANPTADDPQ